MALSTQNSLEDFQEWITGRGLSEDTATGYASDVRGALVHDNPERILLEKRRYAAKTLHRKKAALLSWARFTHDRNLEDRVRDLVLPSAVRKHPAEPWELEEWQELRDAIDKDEFLTDAERAALGMIATRGFRAGDVLRMTPVEVKDALETGVLAYVAKRGRTLEWGADRIRPYLKVLSSEKRWQIVADLLSRPTEDLAQHMASARRRLSRRLKEVCERAGISASRAKLHRFRRTYAVEWLEAAKRKGLGLEDLKAHMQWANLATAEGYVDHKRREKLDEIGKDL